jgi:chorismate synthase
MSSTYGKNLKISIFGQSHGKAIGVVIDGLPAGETLDREELHRFMARRKPGGPLATPRKEADDPVFLSGLLEDRTCGSPLCTIIENNDAHSKDYEALRYKPRPGHADYAAFCKWQGNADMRGGGHFSGRLTAPLCIAGGIAKQILARKGIFIGAHLSTVGKIADQPFPLFPTKELFYEIAEKSFPVLDDDKGETMRHAIAEAAKDEDSVGGIIECAAIGVPCGIGAPMFDGVENRLAAAIFGIPAVKGIEFGAGFQSALIRGSENNDPFSLDEKGKIITAENNSGGILGGITDGMPLVLRAAFKPTPSIGKSQKTVDLTSKEEVILHIHGRHDPCVALRAVPVVEAVTAIVLLDMILEENENGSYGNPQSHR